MYTSCFYDTIESYGVADVNPSKHQEVGRVTCALRAIVYVKDERLRFVSGAKATKIDNVLRAVHYKLAPDRLEN